MCKTLCVNSPGVAKCNATVLVKPLTDLILGTDVGKQLSKQAWVMTKLCAAQALMCQTFTKHRKKLPPVPQQEQATVGKQPLQQSLQLLLQGLLEGLHQATHQQAAVALAHSGRLPPGMHPATAQQAFHINDMQGKGKARQKARQRQGKGRLRFCPSFPTAGQPSEQGQGQMKRTLTYHTSVTLSSKRLDAVEDMGDCWTVMHTCENICPYLSGWNGLELEAGSKG